MAQHSMPAMSEELLQRIKLVRRDLGSLLFHFTRAPDEGFIEVDKRPWR
jgi:hypothetical protein